LLTKGGSLDLDATTPLHQPATFRSADQEDGNISVKEELNVVDQSTWKAPSTAGTDISA